MPAAAQAPPRPPKPYAPVAITRPAASDDASFIAFRAALAAVAKSRIYAELAPLVLAQGFFWGRDFGQRFDPRKPAVDNLAAAIALEHGNGTGWDALAAFAAEAAVEPLDSRPGVVCAPARPAMTASRSPGCSTPPIPSGIDWAYPRADETPVRAAPQPDAAKAGTLGLHFVRLLGFEGPTASRPRPQPMGARRPARRQARLCRPRQPDVADRRTALLRQGLGRRLADCRIRRRGKLDLEKIGGSNLRGRNTDLF